MLPPNQEKILTLGILRTHSTTYLVQKKTIYLKDLRAHSAAIKSTARETFLYWISTLISVCLNRIMRTKKILAMHALFKFKAMCHNTQGYYLRVYLSIKLLWMLAVHRKNRILLSLEKEGDLLVQSLWWNKCNQSIPVWYNLDLKNERM